MTCLSPRRSNRQAFRRTVTPLRSAASVRLADDLAVRKSASTIISGNDTSSIAATNLTPNRRVNDGQRITLSPPMRAQPLRGSTYAGADAPEALDAVPGHVDSTTSRRQAARPP